MPSGAARIKLTQRAISAERPFAGKLIMRFPRLLGALHRFLTAMPHGRFRRTIIVWCVRALAAGGINREDYELMRAAVSPDVEIRFAPELMGLVGHEAGPLKGPEPMVAFVREWYDNWGDFILVPQEVVDPGDGRFLILNHILATGANSGVEIGRQEEAELWEFGRRGLSRGTQWLNWREALEAVGLSE